MKMLCRLDYNKFGFAIALVRKEVLIVSIPNLHKIKNFLVVLTHDFNVCKLPRLVLILTLKKELTIKF